MQVRVSAGATSQPSIPPGSVNEYQLWLGRQRQVWLIPLADETQGVQVKLISLDNVCSATPERLTRCFTFTRRVGTVQVNITFTSWLGQTAAITTFVI